MRWRQSLPLWACYFVIFAGIGGVVGLMPVYLRRLGADPAATGTLLASAYGALAVSNILAGQLAARFQHRVWLLVAGGLAAAPLAWLMSRASTVDLLWPTMTALWFALGVPMTMASILTGLFAEGASRGQSFGRLNLCGGLGLLVGGWVNGPVVDRWGFPALFGGFAVVFLLIPLAGVFAPDRRGGPDPIASDRQGGVFRQRWFAVLFVATILAQAANSVIFLSRPLLMDARRFDATAISTANAVGSLLTLPLPLLIGWLADRTGRKPLLLGCFLAPILGLLVQTGATEPWQFWVSSLLSTVVGVNVVVSSTIATDRFADARLASALSLLNATAWIGVVVGLSAGGLAIRTVTMLPALLLAAGAGLIAVALLAFVPVPDSPPARQPT